MGHDIQAYIGTKVVLAVPMAENDHQREIGSERTTENRIGYRVLYEDGYKSWSPKDVFERAYRIISPSEREMLK